MFVRVFGTIFMVFERNFIGYGPIFIGISADIGGFCPDHPWVAGETSLEEAILALVIQPRAHRVMLLSKNGLEIGLGPLKSLQNRCENVSKPAKTRGFWLILDVFGCFSPYSRRFLSILNRSEPDLPQAQQPVTTLSAMTSSERSSAPK